MTTDITKFSVPEMAKVQLCNSADAVLSLEYLLETPPEVMSPEERHVMWSVLDYMGKLFDSRKKEFKPLMFKDAEEHGLKNVKGSFKMTSLGGSVTKQKRVSMTFDTQAVEDMLTARDIPLSQGGEHVWKPDEKKLENLVAREKLTLTELADCTISKTSFALVVKKPPVVELVLTGGGDAKLLGVQS